MWSPQSLSALPIPLLALLLQVASAENNFPTAIRRQSPDPGAKILPEHLAFAPINLYLPQDILSLDKVSKLEDRDHAERWYQPAFRAVHDGGATDNVLRRAAEALSILDRRQACFADMNSCVEIGKPEKCCQEGTYCQDVPEPNLGEVACCPLGSTCSGSARCPADAVTCPASLGGGCCLSGFECEGSICVPASSSTTRRPTTTTEIKTETAEESADTVTTTRTTMIEGNPSTVVVTLTVTRTAESDPETRTVTQEITESLGAPYRPTSSSSSSDDDSEEESSTEANETTTSDETITSAPESTQTGCPGGFYGCLATNGGGCCRTDRNCDTHDCPAQSSTTVVSDGQTIVVPASDVPTDEATATCADGWFMCGRDAGPRAGCCPSGYDCGTASCFTVEQSQTQVVQKEQPEKDGVGALRVGYEDIVMSAILASAVLWLI